MNNPILLISHPQLDEIQQLMLAEAQKDHNAFTVVPPRLKFPTGGDRSFTTEAGAKIGEVTGVIALAQKARAYWPERSINGKLPMCSSMDGIVGLLAPEEDKAQYTAAMDAYEPHPVLRLIEAEQPLPDFFRCALCPLAQYGSTHQNGPGRGQACKDLRRLLLVIDGWTLPALMTLPPTSCKPFDVYSSELMAHNLTYFGARTRITLRTERSRDGIEYSVAEFANDGTITDLDQFRAVQAIREMYRELVGDLPVDGQDYDTGDVVETTADVVDPESAEAPKSR